MHFKPVIEYLKESQSYQGIFLFCWCKDNCKGTLYPRILLYTGSTPLQGGGGAINIGSIGDCASLLKFFEREIRGCEVVITPPPPGINCIRRNELEGFEKMFMSVIIIRVTASSGLSTPAVPRQNDLYR